MNRVLAVAAALVLLCLGLAAQAEIHIDTVRVGDAGNTADITGYGSVGYTYNVGKYEVTAAQYCDFLNHKAKSDRGGLYVTAMWDIDRGCKIKRIGSDGDYSYSVAADWADRPVNCVSFWDACRFVNWLHNGQGDGDTETGAYTLTPDGVAWNTITRNGGWKWALPSENEWYKAAYYKGGGTNAGYWDYPTQSNDRPGRDLADISGNNANCYGFPFPIQYPNHMYYTTTAGEFQNSDGPYGTFDQGGNVLEWTDTIMYTSSRAMRGGSFTLPNANTSYLTRISGTSESDYFGFRIVQAVPEPSSTAALLAGLAGLAGLRRRWA